MLLERAVHFLELLMVRLAVGLAVIGLAAWPVGASEKYSIKIKREAKGEISQASDRMTESSKIAYIVMGAVQPMDQCTIRTSKFREEVLEKEPGKRATRIRRIYQKAELHKNGQKTVPGFLGKEVLIERTADGYKFGVDGKAPTGDDAAFLTDEFKDKKSDDETKLEKVLFPKAPVAVNETWKPDLAEIAKEIGLSDAMTIDLARSSARGKLSKAYQKGGKQYGVINIDLNLAVNKFGAGGNAAELDKGSKIKMNIQFDGCIDGSSISGVMKLTMEMYMSGAVKSPDGAEVKIDARVRKTGIQTLEELHK